jgi:hypothetical protein
MSGGAIATGLWLVWALLAPEVLLAGRFWAEEGSLFFQNFHGSSSLLSDLLFLHWGHLHIATNVAVMASLAVPLGFAPLVTTYVGFAAQVAPLVVLAVYWQQLNLAIPHLVLLSMASVWLSGSLEILASATNLQWHLAVLTLVFLTLATPTSTRGRMATRGMLLVAGLTGVPSAFWAPSFALRAFVEKDRERFVQFGILAVAALIQIALVLANGAQGRPIKLDPESLVSWTIIQFVTLPLLGESAAHTIARLMTTTKPEYQLFRAIALLAGGMGLAVAMTFIAYRGTLAVKALVIGALISLVLGLAGSLAPAGRYFYAAQVGTLLALMLAAAGSGGKAPKIASNTILIVVIVMGFAFGPRRPEFAMSTSGPSWNQQVVELHHRECRDCEIDIWPVGWKLRISLK